MPVVCLHDHPAPGGLSAYTWAVEVGRARLARAVAAGRQIKGRDRCEDDDIRGMGAEAAVALWFGVQLEDVSMAAERRRGYDVAGYQVRSTYHPAGGLRINLDEHAGRFVLAVTAGMQRRGLVRLCGWITAEAGRPLADSHPTLNPFGGAPWLRVAQADLWPMPPGVLLRFPRHADDASHDPPWRPAEGGGVHRRHRRAALCARGVRPAA